MELLKSCYSSVQEFLLNENQDIKDNIPETNGFKINKYKINQIENDLNDNDKNVRNYPKIIVRKKIRNENNLFGFPNIGHSCYMNSFLQLLLHTPNFLEKLKESYQGTTEHPLIDSLLQLSSEYETKNKVKFLEIIKQSMAEVEKSYGLKIQNDSQEFGINLINQMISIIKGETSFSDEEVLEEEENELEYNKEYKKKSFKNYLDKYCEKEIPLEKMFQFHEIKSKVDIQEKKTISIKRIDFDSFLNIELSFPKKKSKKSSYKLTDLLKEKYPKTPEIENSENKSNIIEQFIDYLINLYMKYKNKYFSHNPDNNNNNRIINNNKLKYIYFSNLFSIPNFLIISINRAILGKPIYKDIVKFEEILDLKDYLDKDNLKDEDTSYTLYGINYCYKQLFANSGHYYCSIKINGEWYTFDDNKPVIKEEPDFNSKYVVGLYYIKNNQN